MKKISLKTNYKVNKKPKIKENKLLKKNKFLTQYLLCILRCKLLRVSFLQKIRWFELVSFVLVFLKKAFLR